MIFPPYVRQRTAHPGGRAILDAGETKPQLIAFSIKGNNMQKILSRSALVLVLALAAPLSLAQDAAPDVLLKAVTLEVLAIIREDKDIQAGDPAKVADLVETRILPLFDFARMTQLAVGRNWRLATPEQQKALTLEFKTLLVRTYSTALSSYRDQIIEYKPLRAAPDATEVTVKSEVRQPGAQRMTIDYEMEKTPAGWKVYDIKVTGVSLVTTYRGTFTTTVRDGGIEGLIKALSDKNRPGGLKTAVVGQQ
jgi:phospholipid transport system substrate-binding protein